jgi:ribosome maturation factor RimP
VNSAQDDGQEPASAAHAGVASRAAALQALVERTLAGMGYELLELERAGGGLLRVTLDCAPDPVADAEAREAQGGAKLDADGESTLESSNADVAGERHVGIEDCERVSRHLTHLFAVEDVDYDRLEVSSPGIDRPLRGARDFARFAGEMAKVQLFSAAEGRRRLRGQILAVLPSCAGGDVPDGGQRVASEGGPSSAQPGARVRMLLLPEAPPPPPKGARRQRARKAVPGETIEFALAEVEKARLAPEWEFDRNAIPRTAPQVSD